MTHTRLCAVRRFNEHKSHEELRYKWYQTDDASVPIPPKTSTSHLVPICKLLWFNTQRVLKQSNARKGLDSCTKASVYCTITSDQPDFLLVMALQLGGYGPPFLESRSRVQWLPLFTPLKAAPGWQAIYSRRRHVTSCRLPARPLTPISSTLG